MNKNHENIITIKNDKIIDMFLCYVIVIYCTCLVWKKEFKCIGYYGIENIWTIA